MPSHTVLSTVEKSAMEMAGVLPVVASAKMKVRVTRAMGSGVREGMAS